MAPLALAEKAAPKTTVTSKTLFLSQLGCGAEADKGKLLPTAGDETGDCGVIGGVPLDEVLHTVGSDSFEDFTSTSKTKPFKIDATKKVTGQLRANSWLPAFGGVGTVTFDVKLKMFTNKDATIVFTPVTVSQAASPTGPSFIPFSMTVPKAAAGTVITEIVLSVNQRGLNVPMSAFGMAGDSYLVIPAKK